MVNPTLAATVGWTNWTTSTGANPGTVNGTLTAGSSTVNVTYTGEIDFTQLNNTGTNFYTPSTTYSSPGVNGPTRSDMIAISGAPGFTDTVTFSSPVTNPLMAIVSLGQPGVGTTYNFNANFTILSQGPGNPYGGCNTCLSGSGTSSLVGHEGDGVIEFAGTFSSLTWTATTPEYWNGFTFGEAGGGTTTSGVPEPASLGLAALALSGLGLFAARKRVRN